MKPSEVPAEIVDVTYPAALAHGIPWHDDAVCILLAAAWPAIEEHVLRTATKQQWEQMIARLADEAIKTRAQPMIEDAVCRGVDKKLPALAAQMEAALREKIATQIETAASEASREGAWAAHSRVTGLRDAARIARGGQQ